jgi:hypothetical protein
MMSVAVLELVCGRCEQWWMRWTADLDRPFDDQRYEPTVPASGVVDDEAPGSWRLGSDGNWHRWTPRRDPPWADGEMRPRNVFRCPNGCPSNVQALDDKLHDAALTALRHLHNTREPPLQTTVDRLLKFASKAL